MGGGGGEVGEIDQSSIIGIIYFHILLQIFSHQDYMDFQKYTNQISHSDRLLAPYIPRQLMFRFLAQTLQPLIGKSESHITNSTDFIQKIQKIRLRPTDLLVSFDVESLFTQVPIKDTLNIIKTSHEISSDLIPLIW